MERDTGIARNVVAIPSLEVLADQGDREAWYAVRRDGLGGSDVSAICGENPFRSPIDVWNDKLHPLDGMPPPSSDLADRLEMGQYLEPVVMDLYAKGLWRRDGDKRFVWRPPMVARRDRPWHRGSCDGLGLRLVGPGRGQFGYLADCNALRGLPPTGDGLTPPGDAGWWDEITECKTHGFYGGLAYKRIEEDEPAPPDKLIQTTWYGALWEVPTISLVALIDTHLRRHWEWPTSSALATDLLTIAEEWWQRHIVDGFMPDPDGTARYARHLKHLYPKDSGRIVKAAPDLDAVVTALRDAKNASAKAEKEVERLEQVIQVAMGDASQLDTHLGKITWRTQAGRLKWRGALDAVYKALGWNTKQVAEHEDSHRGTPPRVFLAQLSGSKK